MRLGSPLRRYAFTGGTDRLQREWTGAGHPPYDLHGVAGAAYGIRGKHQTEKGLRRPLPFSSVKSPRACG